MSSPHIQNENGDNCHKKKDVIDEAIDRIQEKMKQLRLRNKTSESDTERKRRFQERIKTFSSMESNTAGPTKDAQGHVSNVSRNNDRCAEIVHNKTTI